MKRSDFEPELEAFLAGTRVRKTLTPMMRARAMATARAFVSAGGAIRPATISVLRAWQAAPVARWFRQLRVAVAAAIIVAVGAAGAVAALRARSAPVEETLPSQPPPVTAEAIPSANVSAASRGAAPVAAKPLATARAARPTHAIVDGDPFAAELALLQPAHAAYARGDYANALSLVAGHARRFPKGHLAEEREALRVRSLAAAGRTEEAHRATAAFATRFPRSILLPHPEERTIPR